MTLYQWIVGDAGVPGEYKFQTIYWCVVAVIAAFLTVAVIFGASNKISQNSKNIALKVICIFQISFEVLWRVLYVFVKKDVLAACYPTYPCNLGGILVPIVSLVNWKTGKKLFYLFGFVGAILTFAVPDGIFCTNVFVFPILKSVLQHTGLLLIPAFEYACNKFRPSVRTFGWVVLGFAVHFINSELISPTFIDPLLGKENSDYLFYRSGLPFVIPGVSQYITLTVFGAIVLYILSFALNVKDSMAFYRELSSKFRRKTNSKADVK